MDPKLFVVYAWGDAEAREFLALLPELKGAKTLRIYNDNRGCTATVSAEVQAELEEALAARGGGLEYEGR